MNSLAARSRFDWAKLVAMAATMTSVTRQTEVRILTVVERELFMQLKASRESRCHLHRVCQWLAFLCTFCCQSRAQSVAFARRIGKQGYGQCRFPPGYSVRQKSEAGSSLTESP